MRKSKKKQKKKKPYQKQANKIIHDVINNHIISQESYTNQFFSIPNKVNGKTYGYVIRYCSQCGMMAKKVLHSILFCEYCGDEIYD